MDKKKFLEKVWAEVFIGENFRVDFGSQYLADATIDGKKITCDCVSCGEDGVKLHDATKSEDVGWFLVSDDTDIDENSMGNILCSIGFAIH